MKRYLTLMLLVGLTSHADVLNKKGEGVAAVGTYQKTEDGVIYWKNCDGTESSFKPDKSYSITPGKKDCGNPGTNIYQPSDNGAVPIGSQPSSANQAVSTNQPASSNQASTKQETDSAGDKSAPSPGAKSPSTKDKKNDAQGKTKKPKPPE